MKYILKEMPNEERPRERLLKIGVKALSIQELIAIILVTGTKGVSVLEVANDLLLKFKNLETLNEVTVKELSTITGIGEAKAISLLAAIELGKRIGSLNQLKQVISTPLDAFKFLEVNMKHLTQENLVCLYLNIKSEVLDCKTITIGTVSMTIFNPKDIFKWALKLSASFIIVAHNHPSGDPTPSNNDILVTKKIIEVSRIVDIEVIDHIIIGKGKYYSFLEHSKTKKLSLN
ncbi:MAG: DNA repair protein RadC [Candidatus Izemoplasmatales bacterium]|nr:DNA repair protein RadC [Candidatus Izemoplasmatales bacterium]